MNKAKRLFALAGMGIAAGAMIGMGPAQAAPAATQTASGGGAANQASDWDDDYVVGYYRTEWSCERAGWTGKRYDAWEAYDCDPVRYGWRGWVFRLVVEQDDWEWDDWDGPWPGDWPYRPDYAGKPFHIRGHAHGHGPKDWDGHKGGPKDWDGHKGGPKGGPKDWDDHKGPKGPKGPKDWDGPNDGPKDGPPKGMPMGDHDKKGWPKP